MLIKGVTEEDFINYKLPSMFIAFPWCTFKCDKENGNQYCQNWELSKVELLEVSIDVLLSHYLTNPITKAIVCGGLEPLDSFDDLLNLIKRFREYTSDPIVIYTGYETSEISDKVELLKQYSNIIMKFGRFRPNQKSHKDETLGISLASDNQYAKKIS